MALNLVKSRVGDHWQLLKSPISSNSGLREHSSTNEEDYGGEKELRL